MKNFIDKYWNENSSGLTLLELMVAIAIGSIVLMIITQMVVINVGTQKEYEYENYVTSEALSINDTIHKNLTNLQPHHVLVEENAGVSTTVTFSHQYDIIVDTTQDPPALVQTDAYATQDLLVYDVDQQTLSYNGEVINSPNIKILPGTSFTVEYFDDVNYDPQTCTDYNASEADQICGDGILVITLVVAVEFDGGLGEQYTFTTHIII
jgi:prepilin-type N-terminal cleavage/methylation domain-containing protein